jgi:hypothetical protein
MNAAAGTYKNCYQVSPSVAVIQLTTPASRARVRNTPAGIAKTAYVLLANEFTNTLKKVGKNDCKKVFFAITYNVSICMMYKYVLKLEL